MRANVLLVRYEGGQVQVAAPGYGPGDRRYEAALELGGVTDRAEAIDLARRVLQIAAVPRESIQASLLPLGEGGPTALAFAEGDVVTVPTGLGPQRIVSVSYEEQDDGTVQVTPEFVNPLDAVAARLERIIARYAEGNGDGSNLTRPAGPGGATQTTAARVDLPPFSIDGTLTEAIGLRSPPYIAQRPLRLTHLLVGLTESGGGTTTVGMYVADALIHTLTIPAGVRSFAEDLWTTLALVGDPIQFEVLTAGDDAYGLTIHPKATAA